MDLNLLRLFATVATANSFSAAGQSLGMERSSVSRGIATLERELGGPLFTRTTRQMALTSAGAAFHKEIAPHLAALDDATAAASEKDQQLSGVLRLSMAVDMAITFMPAALAGFGTRHPGVRLDVRVENRLANLIDEGIDAALRIVLAPLPDSSFLAIRLSPLAFRAYASPDYLSKNGYPASVEQAARRQWVAFRDIGITGFPKPASDAPIVADDMLFIHQFALGGRGLAILPTFLAEKDVAAGRLMPVLPDQMRGVADLVLLHAPVRRMARRVRAFSDYMIRYFEANPLGAG
jgi:DNA-binding transcriptional LysR family regulator